MSLYYQVESIIDKRLNKKGKPEYKIKWKDYPFEECSWEPLSHLKNVLFMIKEFELNHLSENSIASTNEDYSTFTKKKRKNNFSNYDIESSINFFVALIKDLKRKFYKWVICVFGFMPFILTSFQNIIIVSFVFIDLIFKRNVFPNVIPLFIQ